MQAISATITFYTLYRELELPLHILAKIRETQQALDREAPCACPCHDDIPPIALQFTATLRKSYECREINLQAVLRPRTPPSISGGDINIDHLLTALQEAIRPTCIRIYKRSLVACC